MAEEFDLEAFRLRPGDVPERRRTWVKTPGAKAGDGFVMGPIPVAVLGRAYRAQCGWAECHAGDQARLRSPSPAVQ